MLCAPSTGSGQRYLQLALIRVATHPLLPLPAPAAPASSWVRRCLPMVPFPWFWAKLARDPVSVSVTKPYRLREGGSERGKATPAPALLPFGELPCHDSGLPSSVGRSLIGPVSVRPGPGPYETVGRFFGAGLAPPPRNRPFALAPVPTVTWYGSACDSAPPCGILSGRQCI